MAIPDRRGGTPRRSRRRGHLSNPTTSTPPTPVSTPDTMPARAAHPHTARSCGPSRARWSAATGIPCRAAGATWSSSSTITAACRARHDAGAAAWAQNFSTLVDLAPTPSIAADHFRSAAHGFLLGRDGWARARRRPLRDPRSSPSSSLDDRDRPVRADIYDPDQLDQALPVFADLASPVTAQHAFANAATASATQ